MEIEKKFAIKKIPEDLNRYNKHEIEQGYLCIKPTVRIRKSDNNYYLNYKWKNKDIIDVDAIHNIEYEMKLTKENYYHLANKIDNYLIKKTRYLIPLKDGHTVELDVFHGNLEGLLLAEVEFENDTDVKEFKKPNWFGSDVTSDKRYDNTLLSKLKKYNEIDFE